MAYSPRFLGDYLKQRRLNFNIDFSEIERDTGIRPEYIDALEKRAFDKLPADIYLIPITRQYAKYLGLDEEAIVEQLKQEKADYLNHQNILHQETNKIVLSHTTPITGKKIFISLATSILALVVFYVVQQFYQVSSPPDIVIFEPASGITINSGNILVKGKTSNATKIEFNGKVINTDNDGQFNIPVDLKNGENNIAIVATSNNGQKNGENLIVYANIPQPPALQDHINKGAFTLALTASDTSWISVKTDGETIQKTMQVGDKEEFTGKNISLIAGNAGAIAVAVNNAPPTVLGDKGSVVRKNYSWDDTNLSYLSPSSQDQKLP